MYQQNTDLRPNFEEISSLESVFLLASLVEGGAFLTNDSTLSKTQSTLLPFTALGNFILKWLF